MLSSLAEIIKHPSNVPIPLKHVTNTCKKFRQQNIFAEETTCLHIVCAMGQLSKPCYVISRTSLQTK